MDAATSIMSYHNDMLHLEYLHCELEGSGKAWIVLAGQIGYVAMHKHLAWIEVDNLRRRHTAIGAANPEISRTLLTYEAAEECRVCMSLGLSPSPIALKQQAQSICAPRQACDLPFILRPHFFMAPVDAGRRCADRA